MRTTLSGLLLFALMVLAGCDTTGNNGQVTIPGLGNDRREQVDIRTLYIPTFRNRTGEYGLEDYLSNRVIQQFISDGRLNVKGPDAQLVLRGQIYRYVREPIVYNDQDEVLKYSVGVWVECALYENGIDTPLWRDNDLYAKSTYSDRVAPVETESEVQRRLADDVAVLVANRVLEGWARIQR